ncbi:alpha/beta fold hydrolase [Microbacterium caowuchunii]|uniref:Alpha/beta hydrolase n=1 Tax=Microbacterium caowuchunii TaxID=2614638 RepID=A0A5N0TCZ3_9MICO|nr:alpha/beta hydrolase [Microbacterium caowuchunii]KAA9131716.1 alpha/beta hydrolase [Microbacterium caowuchunii]
MPATVVLPRLSWGDPAAHRHALLIHGLGSSGALMWRFGTALAEAGWHAVAVDLRGHGSAPRALDYTLAAYAADVGAVAPAQGGSWDAVVGHSLGGAAATLAAADRAEWTQRLVLIDPALHLLPADRETVRSSQEAAFADTSIEAVRRQHPRWHPQDVELKAQAAQLASVWAVEQTSSQNPAWDVRTAARRLSIPTHVIGSDPEVYSIFTGPAASEVLAANPRITMSVVPRAGHSPHRDRPEATIAALHEALL